MEKHLQAQPVLSSNSKKKNIGIPLKKPKMQYFYLL